MASLEAFFQQVESWRVRLAGHVFLRHPAIEADELNHCVQQTVEHFLYQELCRQRGLEFVDSHQNGLANWPLPEEPVQVIGREIRDATPSRAGADLLGKVHEQLLAKQLSLHDRRR